MASCVSLQILQPLACESNEPPAQGEASLSPCPPPSLSVQSSCPQHPGAQPVPALVLSEEGGGEGRRNHGQMRALVDWSAERRQRFAQTLLSAESPRWRSVKGFTGEAVSQLQRCSHKIEER